MPRLDRSSPAEGPIVSGFSANGFVVDGVAHRAVLLTPERAIGWDAEALPDVAALQPVLALNPSPEFILLGTGPRLVFAPRALVSALDALGIGIEAMDSRAAARAWGMLRGEGRWIAAALLPL